MDQLKEILRQAVKHRFWIAVGVSALLPLIGYFVAAGSLQAETDKETKTIEAAKTRVEPFSNGTHPNKDYAPEVQKRTVVLTKDVNAAWRKLYERQAPLLTWPSEVSERLNTWGRKWPTGVDDALIADTINSYVLTYDTYVDQVYKSFRPFDYETGEGVVSAPSKEQLLRPQVFSPDAPPTLGKVWESQERLWVQRTVLDVVDKVNGDAKDWDGAIIKQITALDVASDAAQDQKSFAKGDLLENAAAITNPNAPAETTAAAPDTSGSGSKGFGGGGLRGGGEGGGGGMGALGGMGSGNAAPPQEFKIIKPKTPTQQYQVVPVYVAVYIDQSRIPDLLVGFQNSPMTVQVLDFEMLRPASRVKKPAVGDAQPANMMGMGMGGYGMESMMNMGGMGRQMAGMGGSGRMMPGYGRGGSYEDMMGGMGRGAGGLPPREARKGISNRDEILKRENEKKAQQKKAAGDSEEEGEGTDAEKEKAKDAEKKKESNESKINDPYFNIIEVRIYGQARFYNTPPPEETPQSQSESPGNAPAATDAAAATPPATPAGDAAKADSAGAKPDDAAKTEAAKEGATNVEEKKAEGEAPKADGDMPADKKDESPKAEDTKDAAAKPDEAKKDPSAEKAPASKTSDPAAPKADAGNQPPKR